MSADAQSSSESPQTYGPGQNPNSLANLRPHPPWEPGKSPNAGGVRKGQVYVGERIKYLITLTPEELDSFAPATVADEIALARVKNARSEKRKGLAEAQMVTDRTEGKAKQPVEMSGQITITTDLVIAFHQQIHALIVSSVDPQAKALELAEVLMLDAGEFAARLVQPEVG